MNEFRAFMGLKREFLLLFVCLINDIDGDECSLSFVYSI